MRFTPKLSLTVRNLCSICPGTRHTTELPGAHALIRAACAASAQVLGMLTRLPGAHALIQAAFTESGHMLGNARHATELPGAHALIKSGRSSPTAQLEAQCSRSQCRGLGAQLLLYKHIPGLMERTGRPRRPPGESLAFRSPWALLSAWKEGRSRPEGRPS